MRRPRGESSSHFERKTRLSPDGPRLELEMRQRSDRRRDGCGSSRKRRRDYGGSWGPGQMRRRHVSTFRSKVWQWWRHSVFAPLSLLVSGIRAIGRNLTPPRDRTLIWRVDIFLCRRVPLRGFAGVLRLFAFFVCAFSVYCVLLSRSGFMFVSFVCCASVFLLFSREIRRTTCKSMFPHRVYRISQKPAAS